jgi:hypothetical protein
MFFLYFLHENLVVAALQNEQLARKIMSFFVFNFLWTFFAFLVQV